MINRLGAAIVLTWALAACGKDVQTDGAKSAPSGGAGSAARRDKTQAILKELEKPERTAEQRGRLAAVWLSEGGFNLPADQIKGLNAAASPDVDTAQCATIFASVLERSAKPLVEKRCGPMAALVDKLKTVDAPKKASLLAKECKLEAPEADLPKMNPWALLASAILVEELSADPGTSDAEKQIARTVAYICPIRSKSKEKAECNAIHKAFDFAQGLERYQTVPKTAAERDKALADLTAIAKRVDALAITTPEIAGPAKALADRLHERLRILETPPKPAAPKPAPKTAAERRKAALDDVKEYALKEMIGASTVVDSAALNANFVAFDGEYRRYVDPCVELLDLDP